MSQYNTLMREAAQLKSQALELIVKDSSAEDIVKAEKMITDAESIASKAAKLKELEARVGSVEIQDEIQHSVKNGKPFNGNFGEFLVAVKEASRGKRNAALTYIDHEGKALAEGVGSTGGYLVPQEFRAELMAASAEGSIVRPRARIVPMSRRSIDIPAVSQSATTAGIPHYFGGMNVFWEGEAASMQNADMSFRNMTLTAWSLTAVTHVSNDLLADSAISLASVLTGNQGFAGLVSFVEDYSFLNGNGVGQPLGVVNAPATIAVDRTGSSSGTIVYTDLVNMVGALAPQSMGRAVWVASQSVLPVLLALAGPTATNYAGSYVWGSAAAGVPSSLFGMPIIFSEKLSALGTSGDIVLADFSYYTIGDRQQTMIDSTEQAQWTNNRTSWKVVHRVDGQPSLNLPFTGIDGTTKTSPFVKLTTA